MDAKQLAEIKAREQAATAGPWSVDTNEPFSRQINGVFADEQKRYVFYHDPDEDNTISKKDAAFIAHARTDIPALVEEVERLHGIESELAYEKRANETIPVMNKLVNDSAKKIKEQKNRIAILEKALETAYAEASNAIYFSDRSDYLPGLYDVCKAIKPEIEHEEIGKGYIQQAQEQCEISQYAESCEDCGFCQAQEKEARRD